MKQRQLSCLSGALLALLSLSVAAPSHAAEGHFPAGVWRGTIGSATVMACLNESGDSQYYYLRHKAGIALVAPADGGNGREVESMAGQSGRLALEERMSKNGETEISGRWQLEATSADALTGTWSSPASGKTAPIRLTRVSANAGRETSYPGDCPPAYYEPIRAELSLKYFAAKFGERAYRKVSSDQATAFEVLPDTPHADKLNRYALEWLRNQSVAAYDCSANLGHQVEPLDSSLLPVAWTDQYLVLQDLLPDTYCGGAHGNSSLAYLTWSLPQGKLVDTWAWLQGGQKSLVTHAEKHGRAIPSGLFRLIAKAHPRNTKDDDCSEVIDQMSVQAPFPSAQGLVFSTDFFHAMRACNDEVRLDWKQLAPYLSEEGRAVVENWPHAAH